MAAATASLLDQWRYIIDTGALDWVGCCDHDNGGGREYSWWIEQKLTDVFYMPGRFAPLFSYERSVVYPEGPSQRPVCPKRHSAAPAAAAFERGIERTCSRHADALSPTCISSAEWWRRTPAAPTWEPIGGTTIRQLEPIVEIYQGMRQSYEMPGGPRSNSEKDSIGGWRPKGFINLAFAKGYQMAFQASSDHISTHTSFGNVFVTDDTRRRRAGRTEAAARLCLDR